MCDEDDEQGISKYRKLFDDGSDMDDMETGEDRVWGRGEGDGGRTVLALQRHRAHNAFCRSDNCAKCAAICGIVINCQRIATYCIYCQRFVSAKRESFQIVSPRAQREEHIERIAGSKPNILVAKTYKRL